MKLIEDRILKDGRVLDGGILKVDGFLNHQIDVALLRGFAEEVKRQFADCGIDKILTIETSGIAVAYAVAEAFGDIPLLFAKKSKSATLKEDLYSTEVKSFTRNTSSLVYVSKFFLHEGEKVLLVDDFLAEGNASLGLIDLCDLAGAKAMGLATVIEKLFQGGRARLEQRGVRVFAGASIKAFVEGKPVF